MMELPIPNHGAPGNGNTSPLVSVCIPTYNRSKTLERAINSLYSGDYENIEIIISDNASSDETYTTCTRFLENDKRIRYFRSSENIGPIRNFNFSKAQATGKYFVWLADDDYFDPMYISSCVRALEDDSSLVLAAGLGAYHKNDGSLAYYGNIIQAGSSARLLRVFKYLWLVSDNSIFHGVYRRDLVINREVPEFLAGDWAWIADVLLRGKARVIKNVCVHREFENSTSSSLENMVDVLMSPTWHKTFHRIAISHGISCHMDGSLKMKNIVFRYCFRLCIILVTIFSLINIRSVVSRIPHLKNIYKFILNKKWHNT